jgi:hypothetical protein
MQRRLATLGVILVVGCGLPLTIGQIQADAQQQAQHEADMASADQLQLSRELPSNPPDAVWALVKLIGEDSSDMACLMFSATAKTQLAATVGETSCPTAIDALSGQVTDPNTYTTALTVPQDTWSANGDTATVNGCAATWDNVLFGSPPTTPPGPLPGRLTLTRLDNQGWLITNYQAC